MDGGAIYGSGKKGRVMDVACVDSESLCSKLVAAIQNTGLPEVEIYTLDGKQRFLTDSETLEFISAMANEKELVAKEYLIASRAPTDFKNEITMILTLQKYMKGHLDKFTTVGTFQKNIIGVVVDSKYYTFFRKCGKNVYGLFPTLKRRNIDMLIENILSTLVHLNKHMFHMDLKLNNIIWCESTQRYTLIDWEKSVEKDELRHLTLTHGKAVYPNTWRVSPILIHVHRGKDVYSIEYSTAVLYTWINYRHNFKISYADAQRMHDFLEEKVMTPIHTMIHDGKHTDTQIYDKYCNTFDLYAFGISLLIIAVRKNLPKKYFDFIESIMNIEHPDFAINPAQALGNYRRMFGSRQTLRKKRIQ